MSKRMDEIHALNRELDRIERNIKRRRAVRTSNERYNRKHARNTKQGRIIYPDWSTPDE